MCNPTADPGGLGRATLQSENSEIAMQKRKAVAAAGGSLGLLRNEFGRCLARRKA